MKYHRPSPVQRLDPTSQAKWEERLEDPAFVNLIPTCASMASFMNQRCRTLETIDLIWQTMRRAIWWEVTEYPMRVYQHLLPRILTLGFVYSVMMREHSISYCQNFNILSRSETARSLHKLS